MARTTVLKLCRFMLLLLRGSCGLECRDGQYQSGDLCRECKSTCAKCISEFLCTECEVGLFGEACTKNCSLSCFERRCAKKTGNCYSCNKGYYVKNDRCEECPEKCTECQNEVTCTDCRTGYTGIICKKLCVNCKPNSGCSLNDGICYDGCEDGYSGYWCLDRCNSNCYSCNRVDTKECIACAYGKYGNNCEKLCPTKCIYNICNKDGTCTHGCQNGFWGDQCEYVCPISCRGGTCRRSIGICSDGCSGNFTGTKCLCPRTCDCDADGACTKCDENTGYVCDKQCRSMCINNICSLSTEKKCLYGCRDRYESSLCTPLFTVTDDESSHQAEKISLAVVSAVLFIMTGTIVCFLYRRRKSIGASRMNGNQQTERRLQDELSGTYSEAYVHDSEQCSVPNPSSAAGESSYITPVYKGVCPQNRYEIMDSEYIPLTATDSSGNQYRQPAKETSESVAYDADRKSPGASRMKGNQQTEGEISGTYSVAYVFDSEQCSVPGPSSAVGESSYITPLNTGVNPRNQSEKLNSEYLPLSATDSSENQYLQPANEISTSTV